MIVIAFVLLVFLLLLIAALSHSSAVRYERLYNEPRPVPPDFPARIDPRIWAARIEHLEYEHRGETPPPDIAWLARQPVYPVEREEGA